jgi:small-conductance mechanosensitive channel
VYKIISDPIKDLFADERTIGKYTFTINDIFIFFLIISISVIITKIVSYFASETNVDDLKTGNVRKAGVGSWLLLIRVGIMSIGIFLAFAAAGFPMERITIIIGALGVGIGFGLQTIVNNLISGLIIAFEKPVNVNDIVEIAGQSGIVKSIGFRSSVIAKWDGPDVIIPNGDLLNAHLINWTMAGSKRQMKLVVSIARGTDLQKPSQIINGLLAANEHIHHHPAPSVLFQNLVNNAIDINVIFWVKDYKDGASVKSEIIAAIDSAFKENDIQPPFPQKENYILPVDYDNKRNTQNKNSES